MTTSDKIHKDKKSYDVDKTVIENHRKVANHLDKAAKYHLEAANLHEDGHHIKAAQSIIAAQGHLLIADENQQEIVRLHALQNKID
ncbi:hypothetical protein [Chondrinema litorale]|uniref:hypothetical protein n=1 Tax=Chondrinema litorale TaxID=2994555 RepID=UPI00254359D3|nr:hypothetical protein [Chondrinema litorale]UZR99958.1 hypothetical protein OQ292_39395 [Chondrinema litorale]